MNQIEDDKYYCAQWKTKQWIPNVIIWKNLNFFWTIWMIHNSIYPITLNLINMLILSRPIFWFRIALPTVLIIFIQTVIFYLSLWLGFYIYFYKIWYFFLLLANAVDKQLFWYILLNCIIFVPHILKLYNVLSFICWVLASLIVFLHISFCSIFLP